MMRRIGCPGTPRYAGATRRRLRPARIAFHAKFLAIVPAMLLMAACQSYVQQQEVQHKVDVEQDHLRLMVYTSDLTEPYEKLGDLSYSDPLNGETIDTDHINEKLRQMAIERWGTAGRRDHPRHHQGRRRRHLDDLGRRRGSQD
jgi:hypothetical protein